jgi:hypothetical protein
MDSPGRSHADRGKTAKALFSSPRAARGTPAIGLPDPFRTPSEGYDIEAKRLVGNFPQAFSHIALVNTVHNLTQASKPAEQRAGEAEPGT